MTMPVVEMLRGNLDKIAEHGKRADGIVKSMLEQPRATLAQPSRDRRAELQHPAPNRFVGDVEPAFGQQFLDIAVAQGEAEIQPNRVLDDLGREAMAAVAERSHGVILSDTPLAPDPVSVTMPTSGISA